METLSFRWLTCDRNTNKQPDRVVQNNRKVMDNVDDIFSSTEASTANARTTTRETRCLRVAKDDSRGNVVRLDGIVGE